MANKRIIKKQIHYACADLASECIIASESVEGMDVAAMTDIVIEIAQLQDHALRRCSFSFDKSVADFDSRHDYNVARDKYNTEAFRILIKEFNEKVGEIVKKMNALLPAAQREANKAAASK